MPRTDSLNRQRQILAEIIRYYLQNHEAISARTLSKISRLRLSPTTIRNLMEDLSSEGFLTNEGVARGRIPTQKAFTIYVTQLREEERPPAAAVKLPPRADGASTDLTALLDEVGALLTSRTGYVALSSLPSRDHYPLDWVRMMPVPDNQVLVVMHSLLGDLWSRLLPTPEPLAGDVLKAVETHLCQTYRGISLERVRADIMSGHGPLQNIIGPAGVAYRVLRKAFEWEGRAELRVWHPVNLMRIEEFQEPEMLEQVYAALRDDQFLVRALAGGEPVDSGRAVLGTNIDYPGMNQAAVVGFPFGPSSEWQGTLAVLGPMRMDYPLVIHLLKDCVAHLDRRLRDIYARAAS